MFGEYGVIYRSHALTVPYPLFVGQLAFPSAQSAPQKVMESNQELKAFACYLAKCGEDILDLTSLQFDLGQGLYFNSTIPLGFGLGSSGALCAAIYQQYKKSKDDPSLEHLLKIFIRMESYFHGLSSGMDPLTSYLGTPLLFHCGQSIAPVDIAWPREGEGEGALFLLNTGRARRTEPLVNLFLEKCKSTEFEVFFKNTIIPTTNQCIHYFLQEDTMGLWESFRQLSICQFERFQPMIPPLLFPLWERGLREKRFALKLCGAGGGGFLLGMTKDLPKLKQLLGDWEIRPVCFLRCCV